MKKPMTSLELKLYCTLAQKKLTVKPLVPGQISMYACGVTVYDDCHIGHAMQAIFFDVYRHFLEYLGYKVIYVRNYTDVDDKIIKRAAELKILPNELAERVITSSIEDFRALKITPATYEPRVSESIPEILTMVGELIAKGYAYSTEAKDVYYRVRQKSDYGKLSNRKPDELQSGSREIQGSEKADSLDFALWKADTTKGASWDSPYGAGRPGWHIECSAMAKKFLGPSFDIHGGGLDLIFPHHENEIAQSEAANGCGFANVWMHCGLLTLDKQKMSKSLGNSITIKDFLQAWPPEVLRLAFIQNHYRSPLDFSEEVFRTCLKRLLYYYQCLASLDVCSEKSSGGKIDPINLKTIESTFIAALCDDFNTPQAIATLNTCIKTLNQGMMKKQVYGTLASEAAQMLRRLAGVLGLLTEEPKRFITELKTANLMKLGLSKEYVEGEIARRIAARAAKNWSLSDEIRDALAAKGIALSDDESGTQWGVVL